MKMSGNNGRKKSDTTKAPYATRRFWYRAIVGLLVLLLALRIYFREEAPLIMAEKTAFLECPCPLIFAHRGASGTRPENTLLAFRQALELGADILELDIRGTRDHKIIVFHASNTERVTGQKYSVAETNWSVLSKLDAGYYFTDDAGKTHPFRGTGIRISTLREVLRAFPDRRINIEIKSENLTLTRNLYELIRVEGAGQRVLVASASSENLEVFRSLNKLKIATGTSFMGGAGFLWARISGSGYRPEGNALQLPHKLPGLDLADPALIRFANKRNLPVHYFVVDEVPRMEELIQIGAHGIMTNYPGRAFELLKQRGLR